MCKLGATERWRRDLTWNQGGTKREDWVFVYHITLFNRRGIMGWSSWDRNNEMVIMEWSLRDGRGKGDGW